MSFTCVKTFGQASEKVSSLITRSIELRLSASGFYNQYIVNPNYCIVKGKHEYSFGFLYKELKFDYLVIFKKVPSHSNCFGITAGFINNIKDQDRIRLRIETDLNLVMFTSNVFLMGEKVRLRNTYTGILMSGLNLKIPVGKSLDLTFLFQLAVGYGLVGSGKTILSRQHGEGLYVDEVHYLGVKYKF